jgi:predicted PurR-regulated permease PerM
MRVIVRLIALLFSIALALWLVYTLRTVLLLLILSVFFCYLIAPIVRLFERPIRIAGRSFKLPRGAAILIVYLLLGALLSLAVQLMAPKLEQQFKELASNLPRYAESTKAWASRGFDEANAWFRRLKLPSGWREALRKQSEAKVGELLGSTSTWFSNFILVTLPRYLVYMIWLILVPILSFFMLKDAELFTRGAVKLLPTERLQRYAHGLLLDISKTLAAYIRAQITACLIVGALATVGFTIIGAPYSVALGLISGMLEFFPMIGPLVSALISLALTLATSSLQTALAVALFLIVLRVVQDYLIYPRLIGRGIKMHPLAVILAILCGEQIGGPAGIFLAIPVVGMAVVAYNHYLEYSKSSSPDHSRQT